MPEIVIHLVPGADTAAEAAELEAYLRGEEGVDPVAVEVEQPRLGPAEILAVLELANNAIDLTQKLISYLRSGTTRSRASRSRSTAVACPSSG
ncbi:MAG: hypothetical protein ACRDPO_05390 [Streptosporangiaceae bacterium]